MGIFMTLVASGLPLVTAKICAGYNHTDEVDKKNISVTSATIIAIVIGLVSTSIIALFQGLFSKLFVERRLYVGIRYSGSSFGYSYK